MGQNTFIYHFKETIKSHSGRQKVDLIRLFSPSTFTRGERKKGKKCYRKQPDSEKKSLPTKPQKCHQKMAKLAIRWPFNANIKLAALSLLHFMIHAKQKSNFRIIRERPVSDRANIFLSGRLLFSTLYRNNKKGQKFL